MMQWMMKQTEGNFVARFLFLRIMRQLSTKHRHGPFPLFCDDLRPSNVIVDADLNVRGVIDW
jgi:aminoglycoside phosphotransferase (APT) family kinase protein